MAKIPLHGKHGKGQYAIIDDEDYLEVSKYRWHLQSRGYAAVTRKSGGVTRLILMHRLIANTPPHLHTDHINHNKLDNRKANLRVCDRFVNQQNRLDQGCLLKRVSGATVFWWGQLQKNGVVYKMPCRKDKSLAEKDLRKLLKEKLGLDYDPSQHRKRSAHA